MRRITALALLATGCGLFQTVADRVEGALDRLVAVGIVTLLEVPDDERIDLSQLDLQAGMAATAFLADAASVTDLDNAPVSGQTLEVEACGTTETLEDQGDGSYLLLPPSGLDGCAGPDVLITRLDEERPTTLPITLPPAATIDVPGWWTAGDPLSLDLSGSQFDSVLAVLIDTSDGAVAWSNEPQGVGEWYRFLTGRGDATQIEIPGEAFADERAYVLAVTGLDRTPNVELDNANEALSVVAGGRVKLYGILTWDVSDTGVWDF